MSIERLKVLSEKLTIMYDPDDLGFETTDELDPIEGPIGQERAISSMELALDIEQEAGFNLLIFGALGTGKNQALKSTIDRIAATKPKAEDLGYVYNFADPSQPRAVMLPGGMVSELRKDMDETIETCRREVARIFEREDYAESIDRARNDFLARHKTIDGELQNALYAEGLTIEFSGTGPIFQPMRDGRKMTSEELGSLPKNKRVRLEKGKCDSAQLLTRWQTEKRKLHDEEAEQIGQLDHGVVSYTITPMINELLVKYNDGHGTHFSEAMGSYLEGVRDDIIENSDAFKSEDEQHWGRYRVNVLVDNQNSKHAPIVFDYNPGYHNLFGRIDHVYPNAPTDDFMLIKPGSLHRANGGYLVLQARDLLNNPLSWDTLKRTLRSGQFQIENIRETDIPLPSSTIRPETIPINVKVIVVATVDDRFALRHLDGEFDSYFKVTAAFDWRMTRTPENIQKFASFVAATVQNSGLHPFDKTAVARLIDHSSRLAEDQNELTTVLQDIADVITEANYWAEATKHDTVTREDVAKTVGQRKYRASLWKDFDQRRVEEGRVQIDTEGSTVGQINGFSVSGRGEHSYGIVARTTAKAYLGRGQLINVEREAKMTRPIYDKGFMVLKGYLNGKYGQKRPLPFSASFSFEQGHSRIDGDSASSTELYALLSELSGLPLSQGIGVTGAVNQNGDVQVIGGGTHKVESFFDLCVARGLDGTQGVIVPKDNLRNLILKGEVLQAVSDGLFHIYAVSTIDEGIEVLTGVPAGRATVDGQYPEGTVHQLVEKRLERMALMSRDRQNEKKEETNAPEDSSAIGPNDTLAT